MKLCAILNIWEDSSEFLGPFIANTMKYCDGIIVVASTKSNYGEVGTPYIPDTDNIILTYGNITVHAYTPALSPQNSETDKRNFGLAIARSKGYTHFITCDTDEFYDPEQFLAAKEQFHVKPDLNGLVVESYVYFKSPTLTIGKDVTLVPHIHKLTPTIKHEFNKQYPFAWEGKKIRIDPTRSFNINSGVEMFDCPMHHYSHVRKDYEKKLRNSTARANLQRSTILQDYLNAEEGYFCQFYQKRLVRVPSRFGIPEYGGKFNDENL